jgi:hypothetical protein
VLAYGKSTEPPAKNAPPPRRRRALQYSAAEWRWFDKQTIDLGDLEQVGLVAGILMVNSSRMYDAIKAAGTRAGAIRKWIAQQPRPEPKPSRWRRRR